ncbi:hypothetical protein Q8A67_024354 [Cirrhinus molitorella]|uniref:Uncharacterized protein n=1 Tax=Cirrhinus molitorella TaxID=172907 RepID=A0AA88NYC0_9TELE|nr:hypothetical protein Q8A67_024354 [Cirrhinus molitorella]
MNGEGRHMERAALIGVCPLHLLSSPAYTPNLEAALWSARADPRSGGQSLPDPGPPRPPPHPFFSHWAPEVC